MRMLAEQQWGERSNGHHVKFPDHEWNSRGISVSGVTVAF
jgi:hypothetical protein